jgi:glutathione S-transferase
MLTLHYFPSNASITPHILLEELGVPFTLKLVDRAQGAHKSAEYLRLNPNGLIPVLIDDDLVLYETAAICLHLLDKFPEKQLMPALGTNERAMFYKWLIWMTNTVQPAFTMYFYTDRFTTASDPAQISAIKSKTQLRIGEMFKQLDDQLAASGGPWLLGETFSALDVYAFMLGRWSRGFVTMVDGATNTAKASDASAWPHLAPFLQRMLQRDSVKRVVEKEGLKPPLI